MDAGSFGQLDTLVEPGGGPCGGRFTDPRLVPPMHRPLLASYRGGSFEEWQGRVARALRGLADRVDQVAVRTDRMSGLPDHVGTALDVVNMVHREVVALHLHDLVRAAAMADHPTARATPAQLLDRATSALADKWHSWPDGRPGEGWMLELAEAALRGAEVLR